MFKKVIVGLFIPFLVMAVVFTSCKKDENARDGYDVINLDASNFDAPAFPSGSYISAAKFPAATFSNLSGRDLSEIDFYIKSVPANCFIVIYEGTDANGFPANEIYSQSVSVNGEDWNTHVLTSPITLGSNDIWLAVEYTQTTTQNVLGCDPGPAKTNGDWHYDEADQDWIPLSQRGGTSINWNIRGWVSPN